jgi:hypothetical protein
MDLIKSTARLFKNKLFYIIIAVSFISIVLNDIKDYELLRFGEFNEAFEKIDVLKKDGDGNFVWLFGNDLIRAAYNNRFNPTIKDLLTKYPIEGERYGSKEFTYRYEPNVISLIISLIILIPLYIILTLGISSIALLNKKWDFDKTVSRVLIAIIIFLIISFTGNINN